MKTEISFSEIVYIIWKRSYTQHRVKVIRNPHARVYSAPSDAVELALTYAFLHCDIGTFETVIFYSAKG